MQTKLYQRVIVLLGLAPLLASAQSTTVDLNAEFFKPVPGYGFLGNPGARLLSHFKYSFEALLNFADDPVILVEDNNKGDVVSKLVDNQSALDVLMAVGIKNFIELGVALPIALFQSGDSFAPVNNGAAVNSGSLGDLRLSAKVRLLGDPLLQDGLYLSLLPSVSLPTGSGQDLFGASGLVGGGALLAEWRSERLAIGGTVGSQLQKSVEVANLNLGSVLDLGMGVSFLLNDRVTLLGEANTAPQLSDLKEGNFVPLGQTASEARVGAKIKLAPGVWLPVGAGVGLSSGFGSPDFRLLMGVILSPETRPDNDPDADGIFGDADKCPADAEDLDKFADKDGCPDPDNDNDKIADTADQCINDPEDIDSFKDEDGCPDPDNDNDKVADVSDRCPDVPGQPELQGCPLEDKDKDGISDSSDRCPENAGTAEFKGCPDSDGDKLADLDDKCPKEAEDFDKIFDEDGCPETDGDGDTFADEKDICALEPEDFKGEAEGCPETVKATLRGGKIFILDKVYFDVNKDTIKKQSFGVLDAVVKVLSEHPEITKIEIQGHTDDQGKDEANLELSERRAKRVKEYLASKGITEARLQFKGFGEKAPLESIDIKKGKDLKAAREKNRRVEFVIIVQEK